jgi:hypothetical protein
VYWRNLLLKEIFNNGLKIDDFRKLKYIALAESSGRQFDKYGRVLSGVVNNKDKGLFQISETYWGEKSRELGFDIHSVEGNVKMAVYLYKMQGTKPWIHSRHMWITYLKKQNLDL